MDNITCKICSMPKGDSLELSNGAWTELSAMRNEDNDILIVAIGDGRAEFKPKYCPLCGRQLYKDWWEE